MKEAIWVAFEGNWELIDKWIRKFYYVSLNEGSEMMKIL
jgi:hypothetical protein